MSIKLTQQKILFICPWQRHLQEHSDNHSFSHLTQFTLALASIAEYLEQKLNVRCHVHCSTDHSIPTLERLIKLQKPTFLAISCLSYNRFACVELARLAKKIDQKITVILGGIHATYLDHQILTAYPDVDYIIRGEGEETFRELIQTLLNNQNPNSVKGISYRRDNSVIRNASRPRIANLDALPLIDYKKFFSKAHKIGISLHTIPYAVPVEMMRGCPFRCLFCSSSGFWERTVTTKSIPRVIRQLSLIPPRLRHFIFFNDLNLTFSTGHLSKFCRSLIKSRLNIHWGCQTRINLVNTELLKLMKKAGCKMLLFGIESLSQKILQTINKKMLPASAVQNANLCSDMGLVTVLHFIIGFPNETEQTLRETLINCRKLRPDIHMVVHPLEISPGAPLYEQFLKEKKFDESYWLKDHRESMPIYTGSLSGDQIKKWLKVFKQYTRCDTLAIKSMTHTDHRSDNVILPLNEG